MSSFSKKLKLGLKTGTGHWIDDEHLLETDSLGWYLARNSSKEPLKEKVVNLQIARSSHHNRWNSPVCSSMHRSFKEINTPGDGRLVLDPGRWHSGSPKYWPEDVDPWISAWEHFESAGVKRWDWNRIRTYCLLSPDFKIGANLWSFFFFFWLIELNKRRTFLGALEVYQ